MLSANHSSPGTALRVGPVTIVRTLEDGCCLPHHPRHHRHHRRQPPPGLHAAVVLLTDCGGVVVGVTTSTAPLDWRLVGNKPRPVLRSLPNGNTRTHDTASYTAGRWTLVCCTPLTITSSSVPLVVTIGHRVAIARHKAGHCYWAASGHRPTGHRWS